MCELPHQNSVLAAGFEAVESYTDKLKLHKLKLPTAALPQLASRQGQRAELNVQPGHRDKFGPYQGLCELPFAVTGAVRTLTFLAKFIKQSYDEKWAARRNPQ